MTRKKKAAKVYPPGTRPERYFIEGHDTHTENSIGKGIMFSEPMTLRDSKGLPHTVCEVFYKDMRLIDKSRRNSHFDLKIWHSTDDVPTLRPYTFVAGNKLALRRRRVRNALFRGSMWDHKGSTPAF